jgi:FKBP-type peptidyl-prolyl cis-trans isomerase SlyD
VDGAAGPPYRGGLSREPAVSQTIQADKVVLYHFTLRDAAGNVFETTVGGEPDVYLHGHDNLVDGLEAALAGKAAGARFDAVLSPEDSFGHPDADADADETVARDELPEELTVNDHVIATEDDGTEVDLWVKSVAGNEAVLTRNHPLAGQTVTFSLEVLDVRDAHEHELSDGLAWGWSGEESPWGEEGDDWDGSEDDEDVEWEDGDDDGDDGGSTPKA